MKRKIKLECINYKENTYINFYINNLYYTILYKSTSCFIIRNRSCEKRVTKLLKHERDWTKVL